MRVMKAWHICPKWDLALGAGAKAGSTMLAKFVQANKVARLPLADQRYGRECWSMIGPTMRRVAIVRHPVDRFASLYANIQQRPREPMNFYKQLEGLSPWDCFDKLIQLSPDLTYDFHFQPQTLQLGPKIDLAVRLEDFSVWVAQALPSTVVQPTRENTSTPVEIDDRTAARVKNRYRDDLRLWEKAWASSTSSASATAASQT